jgi:hypothetical protein
MTYKFNPGDRVRSTSNWTKTGEVTDCVPGNGSYPWYFVRWDDGTEDRYTDDELEAE